MVEIALHPQPLDFLKAHAIGSALELYGMVCKYGRSRSSKETKTYEETKDATGSYVKMAGASQGFITNTILSAYHRLD